VNYQKSGFKKNNRPERNAENLIFDVFSEGEDGGCLQEGSHRTAIGSDYGSHNFHLFA
jgi:hypothetical protein